ncbi:MAG TPA: FtsX-like permease family protein [Paracoccaceae bacterium]|nr:FtsX-like permease family protein [Paracoccaceae bacterium]
MNGFALRLAFRELRGGLAGFRVFLVCLVLGVGGIAAVSTLTAGIEHGLTTQGRAILGGDASLSFTYRAATADERAWMAAQGGVSETVHLRSMLSHGDDRALTEVKAVDAAYPLYGAARLAGGGSLHQALAIRDGLPGLVTDRALAARLALEPGDEVRLGSGAFKFRGVLEWEPDLASAGMMMAPRTMTSVAGLRQAGMLAPGVVYDTAYRLRLPGQANLAALRAGFERRFPDAGARWRDRRDAAPSIRRFVERLGAFLTIVGIASLGVGGVGIGAGVRGWLARKVPVIAALRTLGATAPTVFAAYAIQVGIIAAVGIAAGVALGGGIVAWGAPLLARDLPVPAEFGFYAAPLARAALFGVLATALFTAWPLAWLRRVRPAELFRDRAGPARSWPGWPTLAVMAALAVALAGAIIGLSDTPELAAWCLGGLALAFVMLWGLGTFGARLARRLSHASLARRRPALRLALGAVGAPGAGTPGIVLALGLGLGVLSAIGQIDANMQRLVTRDLPADSPAFFLLDVQPGQVEALDEIVRSIDGTGRLETAPMLRGVITHLDGVPAAEARIDPGASWVLRGDRGVTHSATLPPGTELTAGDWWPADYAGPPLVSFAEEEGRELGLTVGSTITVNILGRPITAEVASFRRVEWRGLGINFLMVMNPAALAGAPHTLIATLHAEPRAEGAVMRALANAMPNVTPILVRAQVERIADALDRIGAATRWGALAVLLTGLAVLVGAAAAGEERRTAEAAILKVLGASRGAILASFAIRAALTGALAAAVALAWGTLSAWAVQRFVLDADYVLPMGQTLAILGGGVAISLAAGLAFALAPLSRRPAQTLRTAA